MTAPLMTGRQAPRAKDLLQRCSRMPCACAGHEEESPIMRTRGFGVEPDSVPPTVGEVLRSSGQPLDHGARGLFERRFGHDFGGVRVHTGARAAESARALNAVAYTVGRELVFAAGAYAPATEAGRRLLAHELTHVMQQSAPGASPSALRIGAVETPEEHEAESAADSLGNETSMRPPRNSSGQEGVIRRFATKEHTDIGNAAYERAKPQDQSAPAASGEPALDPALVESFRGYTYKRATRATMSYGELVAAADNFASLAEMERRDRATSGEGVRIPVLSYIWDRLSDTAHYYDLAARNLQHFHPHNFTAWQAWQWTALRTMTEARGLVEEAHAARAEAKDLLTKFGEHEKRAREAVKDLDALPTDESSPALEKTIETETEHMQRLLTEATAKKRVADERTGRAVARAQRAVTINGFGNHFLTDAFAAGHIVTPRQDLLRDYSTKLLGVVEVGGTLNCANVPSLAWHDLDNAFGVTVNNMNKEEWLTYGDDYADADALPGGKTLGPTKEHAVDTTATSLRQLWQAAAGPTPASLSPVLNKLPRPAWEKYPRWRPEQWDLQLRYAAGEAVGANNAAVMSPAGTTPVPKEEVPNPKGNQLGLGVALVSARATCTNLLPVFRYDKFVLPMLGRIKKEYNERFYSGSAAQTVSPDSVPEPQGSVVGHTVAGSLIGGLGGALLGLAIGGPVGAIVGGILGLLGGGLIGGLIGSMRKHDEPTV